MRTALVAGNWKMNGNRAGVEALVSGLTGAEPFPCQTLVCPPYVFLAQVRSIIEGSTIAMGAQNVDWHEKGAYTGEVSAGMLIEAGCEYCLVGHSERRTYYGETDEVVAEKFQACIGAGLTPILCIGETLEERQADETAAVVTRQLSAVMDMSGIEVFGKCVVAYEPVWAIGTGESATPAQADEVHGRVRELIGERSRDIADNIRILYGGSVNADNAPALFAREHIDGALVGGASLKAEEFIAICRAA
ncbi:MAG: triose-phosphate isomerase [Pseudomonadales bacterium]|nr:triose-phosphate isomerase [Pseudomonadales bacterium]